MYPMNITQHPLGAIWSGMNRRCHAEDERGYSKYGARGIEVCPEWRWKKGDKSHNAGAFRKFCADVGPRPPNTSLDRINNDLGYSPDNVRWATPRQQSNNIGLHTTRQEVPYTPEEQMTRRNMWIHDALWAKAQALAKRRGVSAAEIVRVACEKYFQAVQKAEEQRNARD